MYVNIKIDAIYTKFYTQTQLDQSKWTFWQNNERYHFLQLLHLTIKNLDKLNLRIPTYKHNNFHIIF